MNLRTLLLLCISQFIFPVNGEGVRIAFYDTATVNDSVIYLKDVSRVLAHDKDILNTLNNTIVGQAAPPGYKRYIQTEQLCAYRLSPQLSGIIVTPADNKRIIVRTRAKKHSLQDKVKEITHFIQTRVLWPQENMSFEIKNLSETWRTLDKPYSFSLEPLSKTHPVGICTFYAMVKQGSFEKRIPIVCDIDVSCPVLVATHTIDRGKPVAAADVTLKKMKITHYNRTPFTHVSQISNMQSRMTIAAGTIIDDNLVQPIPAVEKGEMVNISFSVNRVSVSIRGVARESGTIGEKIWVENIMSKKLIQGKIAEDHSIEVNRSRL